MQLELHCLCAFLKFLLEIKFSGTFLRTVVMHDKEKTETCTELSLKLKYDIVIIIYVVVNFLFQVIFIFLLFLGMVIYANEVETKEK